MKALLVTLFYALCTAAMAVCVAALLDWGPR